MFTAEALLAAVLLTAPQDAPIDLATAHVLRPSIVALGLAGEVLDHREKGFVMGQDVAGDLAMLQGRWRVSETAPVLDDCERFPDRKWINEALGRNRALRDRLLQRLAVDLVHAEEIRAAIVDVDRRYQIWDAVRDSRCDYYYVTVRRQSLSLLRELIDAEAFYAGRLPSPVP